MPPPLEDSYDVAYALELDEPPRAAHNAAEDRELVKRVCGGETRAFETLVRRHQELVGRIVAGRVPPSSVPDVAQDCFVRAFESLETYQARSPFSHWLARIAVRACQDHWRAQYRRPETPFSGLSEACQAWIDSSSAQHDSSDANDANEARELLGWAMEQLSEQDRLVLTLTMLEGYTASEAGRLTGSSALVVKARAFRARNRLRKVLDQALDGGSQSS
jgi:RNA polymerase sigma-70 factor (ECF subfamily)